MNHLRENKASALFLSVCLIITGCTQEASSKIQLSGKAYLSGGPSPGTKRELKNSAIEFQQGNKRVAQVQTNSSAEFNILLPGGEYKAILKTETLACPPIVVNIERNEENLDLVCKIP